MPLTPSGSPPTVTLEDLNAKFDEVEMMTPEKYGAVGDGSAADRASVLSFAQACRNEKRPGFMHGRYRIDTSPVSLNLDGTAPGEHLSLTGGGQNQQTFLVDNGTGGLFVGGSGVGRQHTVELKNMQFSPVQADSGYPLIIVGAGGGLSTQSGIILEGIYVGGIDETGTGDFNQGVTATGLYRPRINDLRIVQPTTGENVWPFALNIADTYFPVVHDVWINTAMPLPTNGGTAIGIRWHGTTEEGGYFSNCVVNGADVGVSIIRTGREPHFQWFGGHINASQIGMRLDGVKYALVVGALMYSDYVDVGNNYTDFLLEDADGVIFRDNQFRMSGNAKRHFILEPKAGKAGAVVRNIEIHLPRAAMFADTTVAPIYINGATNVTIYLADDTSAADFASYPNDLVEFGPNQNYDEVTIITPTRQISYDPDPNSGPIHRVSRFSASPAISDRLGSYNFEGRNDAGENVDYASVLGSIRDPADGVEDGQLDVFLMRDGTPIRTSSFSKGGADKEVSLFVEVRDGAAFSLQRVSVGANDSGGAGFRSLRIPNA